LEAPYHNLISLTTPRPISRAYVYSLVERIALLEGLLEEQGLAVPPATHPPETWHRSRRNDEIPSIDYTATSSSTPQGSATSESHMASSPCSSDDQIKDEYPAMRSRKRSSIHLEINFAEDGYTKRTKHDSLIMPAGIEIESPIRESFSEVTRSSETCEIDRFAMPPPRNPTSLWTMVHDHTSVHTTSCSTLQTTCIDNCAYDVWGDRSFHFTSYDPYLLEPQHRDPSHVEHHYTGPRSAAGGATNLDFMPLSVSS
jgi:hypothetical protein